MEHSERVHESVCDTSAAGLRAYAAAIVRDHGTGAVAGNVAHHMDILADVLSGTHRYWAGIRCPHCGEKLTQHNGATDEVEDGLSELVCRKCQYNS
jgi:DNA-directed RNA polymerase subunit M/transcription elongation factor TFIIS